MFDWKKDVWVKDWKKESNIKKYEDGVFKMERIIKCVAVFAKKLKENDDYHNVVIIAVSRRLCANIVKSYLQPWRIRSKINVFSWKKVLFSKADVW